MPKSVAPHPAAPVALADGYHRPIAAVLHEVAAQVLRQASQGRVADIAFEASDGAR